MDKETREAWGEYVVKERVIAPFENRAFIAGRTSQAQTITRQAEEIERLRGDLLSLQNMERTVLAWFQCQLDYAAHDGERRPYSMAYSKLIEDKIFNEHALKECLVARQLKETHHE